MQLARAPYEHGFSARTAILALVSELAAEGRRTFLDYEVAAALAEDGLGEGLVRRMIRQLSSEGLLERSGRSQFSLPRTSADPAAADLHRAVILATLHRLLGDPAAPDRPAVATTAVVDALWSEGMQLPWTLVRDVLGDAAEAEGAAFRLRGSLFRWKHLRRGPGGTPGRSPEGLGAGVGVEPDDPPLMAVLHAVQALVSADGTSSVGPVEIQAVLKAAGSPVGASTAYRALRALSGDAKHRYPPSNDLVRVGFGRYRLAIPGDERRG